MERSIEQAYHRPVAEAVVGRDAELASLRDFVAGISGGASALVLEGEAGMGKTTLWRAGVEAAEDAGVRVLQAEPAESETALSFSGLGDLLDPVLDEALEPLPAGQRTALARALVLEEVEGPPPDAHAVGVALLNAFRGLASTRELLVAIDDAQWLDAASAGALAYAARRLKGENVCVLLARRLGVESSLLEELRRTPRCADLEVGPLELAALHQVVHAHLDVLLPRPLLAEVHQASGGNPFYALEIVRTLGRSGFSVQAGKPLPVPDSLHDLVHDRLLALPVETRDFLAAAAGHAHPTIPVTEDASGVESGVGLAPALDARVVELLGDEIRFTHPLLAAGALEMIDPRRRREIHSRLAEVLEDSEARAWQLAASVEEADESVAMTLEQAAEHARARGAPRPAALLLERAAGLTPATSEDDARRRTVAAAYAHHAAGDTDRARSLVEPALEVTSPGPERAGLLVALARVRSYDDDVRGASELYRQAMAEAAPGSLVEAYAQEGFGGTLFRLRERLDEAVDASGRAAATAERLTVPQLEAETLATKALSEAALGSIEASATAASALRLQPTCADRPVLRQPLFAVTCLRFWHDDLRGAHDAYEAMAAAARELGDESSLPYTYVMLGQIDCAMGRFEDAFRLAVEGHAIAEQAGQRALVAYTLAVRALAAAHLGLADEATASGSLALADARATSGVPAWIFATWAHGHLALARGDPARAYETLEPLVLHHRREAICEPGALPFLPDAVEALVDSGRSEDAAELLAEYGAAAERLTRRRGIAATQRLRGLLAAARGDADGARAALTAAVDLSSAGDTPFERARSLLALGATQRRLKRRREARATLEGSLAVFEGIGASLWAERARAELKRISGRAATPGALTPAEERVAALVAEGKTNREVAAALFLSDRTVEGHLGRIFGKLGIRHRTEVAGALQTRGIDVPNTGDSPVSAESSAP
jgi:DNA-binding NarL/FixJ family response regulator